MNPTDLYQFLTFLYQLLTFIVICATALAGCTAIVWLVMAVRKWQLQHGFRGR